MKTETQNKQILEYLMEHREGITDLDAIYRFRKPITRLSGRIFDLRKKGYPIVKTMEKNKDGVHKHARYFLLDEEE